MKLTIVILVTLILIMIFASAGYSKQQKPKSHFEIVRNALTRLIERPSDAFLIIEDPKSGKFVQFAGSKNEDILLDLPIQTLSPSELIKAKSVFTELGYDGPETYPMQEYPNGPPAGEQTGFIVNFARDLDRATNVAIDVLHRIYGFDESTQLQLTEE